MSIGTARRKLQLRKQRDKVEKDDREYAELIKGRRVVFVGPAPYLKGKGWGEKIDDYDIVVRTGGSPPIRNDAQIDYGSKTNVWYVNTSFLHMYDSNRLRQVQASGTDFVNIRHMMGREYIIYDAKMRSRIYSSYIKGIKMPTMGVVAINEILKNNPAEFRVIGVTFFCDGFNNSHVDGYLTKGQENRHEHLLTEGNKQNKFIGMNHDYHNGDLFVKRNYDAGKIQLDPETLGYLEKALIVNKHLDRVK